MTRTVIYYGLVALSLAALAVPSCTSAEDDAGDGASPAETGAESALDQGATDVSEYASELASAEKEFALDLYGRIRSREGNVFFSPHSILNALAMTYVGARGETEQQMADGLSLPDLGTAEEDRFTHEYRDRLAGAFGALSQDLRSGVSTKTHIYTVANAVWYQTGYAFLDRFLSLNAEGFGAEVADLDFSRNWQEARGIINEWVEENTSGKIEELIGPGDLDELVRLVLTNAVYFRGLWAEQFDPESTRDATFHVRPGERSMDVQVPMMTRKGEYAYARVAEPGLSVVELPYAGERASMLVILPDESLQGGLTQIEEIMSPSNLDAWTSALKKREILVSLPRFEITWGTENIIPDLEALGILDLFGDDADLSGMDGTQELYVSRVLHKAFVEVNEEGTEAAAATAVVARLKASMPVEFRADRPFLFFIRDTDTGAVLFMGRVVDPTA